MNTSYGNAANDVNGQTRPSPRASPTTAKNSDANGAASILSEPTVVIGTATVTADPWNLTIKTQQRDLADGPTNSAGVGNNAHIWGSSLAGGGPSDLLSLASSEVANNSTPASCPPSGGGPAGVAPASPWNPVVGSRPQNHRFPAAMQSSASSSSGQISLSGLALPNFSERCSNCDVAQGRLAVSQCKNCNELLCQVCSEAHTIVRIYRDHVIVPYKSSSSSSSLGLQAPASASSPLYAPSTQSGPPTGSLLATASRNLPLPTAASTGASGVALLQPAQNSEVMRVYSDAVEKAKCDGQQLITQAGRDQKQMDETKAALLEMQRQIESRHRIVAQDIKTSMQAIVTALKERENKLMERLNKVLIAKLGAIEEQKKALNQASSRLAEVVQELNICLKNPGQEMALINACTVASRTLSNLHQSGDLYRVIEDDHFSCSIGDENLLRHVANMGYVGGSGFAPNSYATGESLKKALLGRESLFLIHVLDHLNEKRVSGGDPVKVNITAPDQRPLRFHFQDMQNGKYRVVWTPSIEGEYQVSITIKDRHIQESPFKVAVRAGRNYAAMGEPILVFGTEGEGPGQLCRPWGVCCSREGYILVANRSNNRIEVFDKDGGFHHNFGTSGKLNGQFDRPSSVCCDSRNRVIVADKDNHRIQIFTVKGEFVATFGEKGSKPGQFNYPWDVATNSKDDILVSDTRNHRIQLFNRNGEFLQKYGFEGPMWKHFDSPRGVAFTKDDQAVVTDFNNHRLLVVKDDFSKAQFLGKEGSEEGQFTRPNGVAVDEEGHIIVADSRNDRIQVFSEKGVFVRKFGSKGTARGAFDRPSGICISPDGKVIVVDFGSNRVQVF